MSSSQASSKGKPYPCKAPVFHAYLGEIKVPSLGEGFERFSSTENYRALRASMSKQGLVNPVIVDENMVLVHGYIRLEAAKSLGWETIQCLQVTGIDFIRWSRIVSTSAVKL